MKALFIAYNQAYNQEIIELLAGFGQRGYTLWTQVCGRGSVDGDPHLGSHAWPTLNQALFCAVDDHAAKDIVATLRERDAANPALGLRAYVLPVEDTL